MDITFTDREEEKNPDLEEVVEEDNPLKEYVVQYTGQQLEPEDGNVTVGMVGEVFSRDFPEFLMAIAEENFIRGYHQALEDLEAGERLLAEVDQEEEPTTENE